MRLRHGRRHLPNGSLPLRAGGFILPEIRTRGRKAPDGRVRHTALSHHRRHRVHTRRASAGPKARLIMSVIVLLCLDGAGFSHVHWF